MTKDEVLEVHSGVFYAALTSQNYAALEELYSDDYMLVRPDGSVLNKQEVLHDLRSNGLRFHSIDPRQLGARVYGSAGVVTGESRTVTATIEIVTDVAKHANPMGTVHGGVLCDVADAAIGTAHAMGLGEGESFTSLDLQINFFRPVWNDRLRAIAKPVHVGKTVSRYVCAILNGDGKLVAQVTSTVMTLRGEKASGR